MDINYIVNFDFRTKEFRINQLEEIDDVSVCDDEHGDTIITFPEEKKDVVDCILSVAENNDQYFIWCN